MQASQSQTLDSKILEATYLANMESFRQYMPELYGFLLAFKPTQNLLGVDHHNQYNLFNGNAWVYPPNKQTEIQSQVDLFVQEPQRFLFKGIRAHEGEKHHFFHTYYLEKISEVLDALPINSLIQSPIFVPLMVLVGVGIGEHLTMLNRHYDIQILHIYEPNPDVFYASLFTTDYADIIQKYTQSSRYINIQVGKSWTHSINGLSEHIKTKGYFYGAQVYVYCHYRSEAIAIAREKIYQFIHRIYLGLGFYEDEIISINHTLLNLTEKSQLMSYDSEDRCYDVSAPVFIVGNGPSLDQSMHLIKQYQDQAVIVSCSSSLGVLLKNSIVPDFHVETERGTNVYECLMILEHVEQLKEIPLICLNTVYPKVTDLFKECIVAMKTNDVATTLLNEVIHDQFRILTSCNPTSGNGAASVATNLGFKNIYLFGLDLAVIDGERHHSKDSFYFEEAHADKNTNILLNLETEGNFREKVKTSYEWDMAKYSMERLIKDYKLNCFNTSDGALIAGAKPLPIDQFPKLTQKIDKTGLIEHIKEKQAMQVTPKIVDEYDKAWKREYLIIETIVGGVIETFKVIPETKSEFFELMTVQKEMIYKDDDTKPVLYNLFWGTLSHLHLGLCAVLLNVKDGEEFVNRARLCFNRAVDYLNSCMIISRKQYRKTFAEFNLNDFLKEVGELEG